MFLDPVLQPPPFSEKRYWVNPIIKPTRFPLHCNGSVTNVNTPILTFVHNSTRRLGTVVNLLIDVFAYQAENLLDLMPK
jgi:hypothetical protein